MTTVGDDTGKMVEDAPVASVANEPGLVLAYAPPESDLDALPPVILLPPGASITVGRVPAAGAVALPLSSISRTHARVWRDETRCWIEDQQSRNGVLVGGRRVGRAELRAGDDVRIGDALFVFVPVGARVHEGSRFDGRTDVPYPHAPIAGGAATRRLFEELVPIARANIPVLVHGETGTGKELVAQAVHAASGRRGLLRALNCAAIPGTLVESELFGFRRGAFTGADRDSPGIVRAAEGGTLFLDEIADLPLETQPKLLRLLESSEIAPVGGTRTEQVDVRIVCATHANLEALVAEKRFRADLFSRIRGHVVTLPPLRARKEDMVRLVRALLGRLGHPDTEVSVAFMMALFRHDWPFNVRELHATLRRALALASPGQSLETRHLPQELLVTGSKPPMATAPGKANASSGDGDGDRPAIPSAEELRAALAEHGGNVAAVARAFRRDRALIHRWLKQHDIAIDDYRSDAAKRSP